MMFDALMAWVLCVGLGSSFNVIQPYGPRMCRQLGEETSFHYQNLSCVVRKAKKTNKGQMKMRCVVCLDLSYQVMDDQYCQMVNGHTVCSIIHNNKSCACTTKDTVNSVTSVNSTNDDKMARCRKAFGLARTERQMACAMLSRLESKNIKEPLQLKLGDMWIQNKSYQTTYKDLDRNRLQGIPKKVVNRDNKMCMKEFNQLFGKRDAIKLKSLPPLFRKKMEATFYFENGVKSVNCKGPEEDGGGPIFWAAHQGLRPVFDLLLTLGVNLTAESGGCSLLHWVCIGKDLSIVKTLVDIGLDINIKDDEGNTLLHIAVLSQSPELVEYLIRYGCNVEAVNKKKRNILHYIFLLATDMVPHIMKYDFYRKLQKGRDIKGLTPSDAAKKLKVSVPKFVW